MCTAEAATQMPLLSRQTQEGSRAWNHGTRMRINIPLLGIGVEEGGSSGMTKQWLFLTWFSSGNKALDL